MRYRLWSHWDPVLAHAAALLNKFIEVISCDIVIRPVPAKCTCTAPRMKTSSAAMTKALRRKTAVIELPPAWKLQFRQTPIEIVDKDDQRDPQIIEQLFQRITK